MFVPCVPLGSRPLLGLHLSKNGPLCWRGYTNLVHANLIALERACEDKQDNKIIKAFLFYPMRYTC